MKLRITFLAKRLLAAALLVLVSLQTFTYSSGPPAGNTGAPGDGNCTSCHTGSVITSGSNWNNISLTSTIPAGGYTPGQTYAITLSHTQAGISRIGFQATVLSASNTMAGSITATNTSTTQTQSLSGKTYINHTLSGITASGSNSWTFNWTAPATGVGTVTFYAAVNAANSDFNTTGDQIYTKSFSFTQLVSGSAPVASIGADKTTICQGDTIHFTGSGTNSPTAYQWQIPSGNPSSTTVQNPLAIFNTAGTVTVRLIASNAFGSSTAATQTIVVNARPSATLVIAGQPTLCGNNDSIVLTGPPGPGISYLWTPGNDTTRTFVIRNPGSYRLKVTNTNGCSASSQAVNVVRKTKPVVTLSLSADTVCAGGLVTLTASPAGLLSYTFFSKGSNPSLYQNNASNVLQLNPTEGIDSITVVGNDSSCSSLPPAYYHITVQQPLDSPVVSCDSAGTSFVRFRWLPVTGATGYQVSRDSGNTWITPSSGSNGFTHTLSGLSAGRQVQLKVRATSAGKCPFGKLATVTCQTSGCLPLSYRASAPLHACVPGDTAHAQVLVSLSNINALRYAINVNNQGYISASSAMVSVAKGSNSISVKLIDSNSTGCPSKDTVLVVTGINSPAAKPLLSFVPLPGIDTNKVQCDNTSQLLYATAPAGAQRYLFMRNMQDTLAASGLSEFIGLVGDPLKRFNNHDLATVIAIDTNYGCFKISDPLVVKTAPAPVAGFSYTKNGNTVQFSDTSKGNVQAWEWTFNLSDTSHLRNPSFTFASNGAHLVTLRVHDVNGCESDVQALITINTGIPETLQQLLHVSPNPVKDKLLVELGKPGAQPWSIRVYGANGQLVLEGEHEGSSAQLDMASLKPGLYYYVVQQGASVAKGKVVKE